MPGNTIDSTEKKIEIPEDLQQSVQIDCDLIGSKAPETFQVNSASIDMYQEGEDLMLYMVPQFNVHHITAVACVDSAETKKQELQVEVHSPVWGEHPETGEKIREAGIEEVKSPFTISQTNIEAKIDSIRQRENDFKKSQKLKDVRQALKGMRSGEKTIYELADAIKHKEGKQRVKAMELAKEELLAVLQGDNILAMEYVVSTVFSNPRIDPGALPQWSFEPLYAIYTNPEYQQQRTENSDIENLLTFCSWSLGGAYLPEERGKLGALLLSDDIPSLDKKGLVISLGQTGDDSVADVIVQYGKEKSMLDYSMMSIPMVLIETLDAREAYWDLQIHYAERLTQEIYPDETFLGSYYYKRDWEKLDHFSPTDIEAIDRILELLNERESKFSAQFSDWELESHEDAVQRWQEIRELISNRLGEPSGVNE